MRQAGRVALRYAPMHHSPCQVVDGVAGAGYAPPGGKARRRFSVRVPLR
jgi:hypothetical protein